MIYDMNLFMVFTLKKQISSLYNNIHGMTYCYMLDKHHIWNSY